MLTPTGFQEKFGFTPNKNQMRDIERLVMEISRRQNISPETALQNAVIGLRLDKYSGRDKFFPLRQALIKQRYPLSSPALKIKPENIFWSKVKEPLENNYPVQKGFAPLKIFAEKAVSNSELVKRFRDKFPGVEIEELEYYSLYLKKNKFSLDQLKKPLVFIVKENWDFIKPCPCTPGHLPCGYWILNLGFGCPFDCSYCFLQQYTNFPGLILPANLEDFFEQFDVFQKKLGDPIRIGTGEFCDSLALDHITGYSKKLIGYFRDKKVLFELKTKSANVENILGTRSSPNIVISWSLNPQPIIDNEELAAATLEARLEAAKKVQDKGYKIAFHFDPVIHGPDWEKLYCETVDRLYSKVKPPFAWISLGTLRSNRALKTNCELRFPASKIFYGELFLGSDKKLRYPRFLRKEIYGKMRGWLRGHDDKTPVYLCMEDKAMWQEIFAKDDPAVIEESLIRPNVHW